MKTSHLAFITYKVLDVAAFLDLASSEDGVSMASPYILKAKVRSCNSSISKGEHHSCL